MDLNEAIRLLWYGSILLLGVLWIRIVATGLWRVYPWFALYILSLWVESLLLLVFGKHVHIYGRIWLFTRSAVLLMELAAVLEIFARWTTSFEGIGAFGRRLLAVLMAISIVSFVSTLPVSWSAGRLHVSYQLMMIANRSVSVGLAAFLLTALGFFYKFAGPVTPNLNRHTWTTAAFVTANAVGYFFMASHWYALANVVLMSVTLSCLVYWILAFRESGERKPEFSANLAEWHAMEDVNRQILELAGSVKLSPLGLRRKN